MERRLTRVFFWKGYEVGTLEGVTWFSVCGEFMSQFAGIVVLVGVPQFLLWKVMEEGSGCVRFVFLKGGVVTEWSEFFVFLLFQVNLWLSLVVFSWRGGG